VGGKRGKIDYHQRLWNEWLNFPNKKFSFNNSIGGKTGKAHYRAYPIFIFPVPGQPPWERCLETPYPAGTQYRISAVRIKRNLLPLNNKGRR
jgi:hypothetical protein